MNKIRYEDDLTDDIYLIINWYTYKNNDQLLF